MKIQSSDLIHKINNEFKAIIASIEAMDKNINDTDYCKEVISEILKNKDELNKTILEIKFYLNEKASEVL